MQGHVTNLNKKKRVQCFQS